MSRAGRRDDVVRVAHVVVAGEIGGAERMLVDLARSPETEAEHRLFVFSPSNALVTMFRHAGLAITDRGFARENPFSFLRQQLGGRDVAWLSRELARAGTNVVHLHTLGSQVLGTRAALAAGLPVIRTEHSTRVYEDVSAWPFSRWSLERVSLAVAVSQHVHDVARRKAPWAKLRIIHNGVDTDRFQPPRDPNAAGPASPPATAEGRPFRAPAPLALLVLGRLEPRKGVDLALRAVARVPGVALTIAGDGPDRAKLESLANDLGIADRVRFLGHVEDARQPIGESDAILCSSRKEGLGIAFLEAMAMARPVVGLATGGVAEITGDASAFMSLASLSTDDARVDELARTIDLALAHRTELLARGKKARSRVIEAFSRIAMARAYGDAYRSVSVRLADQPARTRN